MKIIFEPEYIWVGLRWVKGSRVTTISVDYQIYTFFICIIPCFPVVIRWNKDIKSKNRNKNW